MFFKFANWIAGAGAPLGRPTLAQIEALTRVHPQVLVQALEHFYSTRNPALLPNYAVPVLPAGYGGPGFALETNINLALGDLRWDHLIYAYMLENTRIVEIFDRVVREFEAGERFETPDADTALWLRSTEALFYRDLGPGFVGSLTSWLRPDLRAIRRNTYYRLLGLDLNHGADGNRPYPFEKPTASNRDFVPVFEALTREVWRGMVNASNTSGARDTDDAAIANNARRLQEMLNLRRNNGNLIREEFWSVVTLSWFHLAVTEDTPVVRALKAEAESPSDRLRKIGARVGVPAHNQSDAYFNMAFPLSTILTFIETSPLAVQLGSARGYYTPTGAMPLVAPAMRTIINYWSAATGRDLKALSVSPAPAMLLPANSVKVISNSR
jgi:hypothetical protein